MRRKDAQKQLARTSINASGAIYCMVFFVLVKILAFCINWFITVQKKTFIIVYGTYAIIFNFLRLDLNPYFLDTNCDIRNCLRVSLNTDLL